MKKTFKAYLDRIEENIGVVYLGEDESHKLDIPLDFLPEGVKEGSKLKFSIDTDKKGEAKIAEEVENLRKQLSENN